MSDSYNSDLCAAIQTEIRNLLEQDTAIAGITQVPGENLKEKARNVMGSLSDDFPEVILTDKTQVHIAAGVFVRNSEPVPATLDRLSAEIIAHATRIINETTTSQEMKTTVTLVAVSVVS